jgi:DNA-3-methyladenine glycosylase II
MPTRPIETEADVAAGLAHLARADKRLKAVIREAGPIGVRRRPPGFAGLARTIVGQQLSVASASAIWTRFTAAYPEMSAAAIARAREARLKSTGLSTGKIRTLKAIAAACRDGLDLEGLASVAPDEVRARLQAVKGVGPWTADIYLLFCLGHPDIFPVGDLALRNAVAEALGTEPPMAIEALAAIAETWSPHRTVAAYLFWAYYGARRARKVMPA